MTVSVHNPDQYMASLRQIIAQGRKRIGEALRRWRRCSTRACPETAM